MTFPCGNCNCYYRETPPPNPGGEDIPLQEGGQSGSQGGRVITQQPGTGGREMGISLGSDNVLGMVEQAGSLLNNLLDSARMQRLGHYCYRTGTPWCREHCPGFLQWIWGGCCACCLETVDDPDNPSAQFLQQLIQQYGPICVGMSFQQLPHCTQKIEQGEPLGDGDKQEVENGCKLHRELLKAAQPRCMGESLVKLLQNNGLGEDMQQTPPWSLILQAVSEGALSFVTSSDNPPTCWILQPEQQPCPPPPTDEEQLQGAVGGAPAPQQKKHPAQECRVTCKLNFRTLLQKLSRLEVLSLESGYKGPLGQAAKQIVDLIKKSLKRLVASDLATFLGPGIGLSLESQVFEVLVLLCLLSKGYLPLDPLHPEQTVLDPRVQGPWQRILRKVLVTTTAGENIWRQTQGEAPRQAPPPPDPWDDDEIERDGIVTGGGFGIPCQCLRCWRKLPTEKRPNRWL
ncbi:hypothetical protein CpB1115 [Chlamydia pneumoniae TW-183]|uniref:Uncharacterized protein n=2 Tax=Chlamydia pneumoniae TaxID=83558 RepID=Q9Z6I9_CHLPN|nr:hypothetical protein [Chlamydia pneumoniae]AAD19207.1 hypothetical protein CPn_1070 [Chlamydia pneumoniae CWL029]AAF38579.1 hypothetical protein CP_0780 [Chlamydia pneumoniae AR39]AAP99043.1 hypothetical protein CpB1115 [Chlamydia pneumoniae TW-183]CRI33613.1 Uncharacterized protein BN1224_Wien1_A_11200 [Chlamydia pneumoniae]CRI36478.1 Uncharacterized protein BN1224_CM1_A_11250 [Chlamydia pneumoniae]